MKVYTFAPRITPSNNLCPWPDLPLTPPCPRMHIVYLNPSPKSIRQTVASGLFSKMQLYFE